MTNEPEQVQKLSEEAPTRGPASSAAPDAGPDPERIREIAQGYLGAKYLFVAVDVGLFEALGTDWATIGEAAGRCGIPARTARVVIDALVLWGLLERDGDRVRNEPDAEAFLTGRGPLDTRPMLRYFDRISYPTFVQAGQAVRTGEGVRGPLDAAETELYEEAVAFITQPGAAALPGAYDFGRHRRLLDVGGGVGLFLTQILSRYEHLDGTLLELPGVAKAVGGQLAGGPVADRVEVVAADVFTDPLPEGHDAILLANVVHLFPPERNLALLRRLREAVTGDGRLLILDWYTGPDAHPNTIVIAGEWLTMSGGCAYEASEVSGWLHETGWRVVEHLPLLVPMSILVAEPA